MPMDTYNKANDMSLSGPLSSGTNYWYSSKTVNSAPARALFVTNGSNAGISLSAYQYGDDQTSVTNLLFFSENIRSGITTSNSRWTIYGTVSLATPVYSNTIMPDGSTNGVGYTFPAGTNVNAGVYQPFPSTNYLEYGKMYTFSVWAHAETTPCTVRLSYFNGSVSIFSDDFSLTSSPQRISFTFIANNLTTATTENVAVGTGSGTVVAEKVVLWGAQLCEGNAPATYVKTSTEYNGLGSGSIGSTQTETGTNTSGSKIIDRTVLTVPANTSMLFDIGCFAVSTPNRNSVAPPSGFQAYGLF